jgi:hypothetical protein
MLHPPGGRKVPGHSPFVEHTPMCVHRWQFKATTPPEVFGPAVWRGIVDRCSRARCDAVRIQWDVRPVEPVSPVAVQQAPVRPYPQESPMA